MKIVLDQSNGIELLREGRIVRGQNITSAIYVEWKEGESPVDCSIIPENYLAVEVNITRPDGEQSGWVPCSKVLSEVRYYYNLTAWDTAVAGVASVVVRWYNSNNDTNDDTTEIFSSVAASFVIDRGVIAQPLPISNENYADLMAIIVPLQSNTLPKYNARSIPAGVSYSVDGAKSGPAVYYNYEHDVYDVVIASDHLSYTHELNTLEGLLFVCRESLKQSEFFFANGKIYYRAIVGGETGNFYDINESFNVVDIDQQIALGRIERELLTIFNLIADRYTKTEIDALLSRKVDKSVASLTRFTIYNTMTCRDFYQEYGTHLVWFELKSNGILGDLTLGEYIGIVKVNTQADYVTGFDIKEVDSLKRWRFNGESIQGNTTIADILVDAYRDDLVDKDFVNSSSNDTANSIKGVGGSVVIETTDWSSNTATKTFTELGDYDCIEFYPATVTDKTNASNADIFVSANGNTVTFTAGTQPDVNITLNYFITRGKA